MRKVLLLLIMVPLISATFASRAQESVDVVSRWDFDVYLNDKKVGKHLFTVSELGGLKLVESEASFTYRFLFIPAYRYEHRAIESWANNCLIDFDANTNANGDRIYVTGEQNGAMFSVETDNSPVELQECVMTFAYWNSEFLKQPRLLNPQTGDFVDVRVERVGDEILYVRGRPVAAIRFKLTAYEVDLTLWYSLDNDWLALESVAKGGHIIRYELS